MDVRKKRTLSDEALADELEGYIEERLAGGDIEEGGVVIPFLRGTILDLRGELNLYRGTGSP